MTFPTPRTALQGNPPTPGYSPRKADLVNVLEQMQAIAGVQMVKDFHGAVDDLPAEDNDSGDKRVVLAPEGDGGGVYTWDGTEWQLIAALPVWLTESISAILAAAAVEEAKGWAAQARENSRLQIGAVSTEAPDQPASADITGEPGAQLLDLGIPRGADGWTPQLAVVDDDERRVLQIVDWVGGEGIKPGTGLYIGGSGLVSDISAATNIRGIPGMGDVSSTRQVSGVGNLKGGGDLSADREIDMADMPANSVKARAVDTAGAPSDLVLAASRLLGRGTTGDVAAISLGTGLEFYGTDLRGTELTPEQLTDPEDETKGLVSGKDLAEAVAEFSEDTSKWRLIESVNISSPTTQVTITGLGEYTDIMVRISQVECSPTGGHRRLRVGNSGGILDGDIYQEINGGPRNHIELHTNSGNKPRSGGVTIYNFNDEVANKPVDNAFRVNDNIVTEIQNGTAFDRVQIFDSGGQDLIAGRIDIWGRG